ncbi:MAG: ABC transporter ATP-binding protein, partial [Lachnospiraceae bacterium]|nr:ABC transporter ATP-binding protein [Lachnospiraceae bacterium]
MKTIKILLTSLREYKKDSLLTPVYVVFESVLEIVIPTIMALLIDNGISKSDMNYITRIGIVLLVCAGLSLLFGILAGRSAALASAGFAKNLRRDMFVNVQSFSFANIDKFSTAGIITRLTTDVSNVQNAFQMIIRVGVRSPVMLVVAMIFAFR